MSENTAPAICGDDTCERDHYAKGLCKSHYNTSLKRTGRMRKKNCAAKECPRMTYGKYCSSHGRRKRAGAIDVPIQPYQYSEGCAEDGCGEEHYAKGYCRRHYEAHRPAKKYTGNSTQANLLFKYGITIEDRAAIAEHQGGVCGICKEPPPEGKPLFVDHDHDHCGGPRDGCRYCVRGLLCNRCNRWMNVLLEDPGMVDAVRAYLEDPPAFKVIEREKPKRGKPFAEERALLKELGL